MTGFLHIEKLAPNSIQIIAGKMEKNAEQVRNHPDQRVVTEYQAALQAGKSVGAAVVAGPHDSRVLLRHDSALDAPTAALANHLEAELQSFRANTPVPLTPEEEQRRADAQFLLASLYPFDTSMLRLPMSEEWAELKRLLETAAKPAESAAIARLGYGVVVGRIRRCHAAYGAVLGITTEVPKPELGAAIQSWESGFGRLVKVAEAAHLDLPAAAREAWEDAVFGPYREELARLRELQARERREGEGSSAPPAGTPQSPPAPPAPVAGGTPA